MFSNTKRNKIKARTFKKHKRDTREVKAAKRIIGALADSCYKSNQSLFDCHKRSFDIIGFYSPEYKKLASDFLNGNARWNSNCMDLFAAIKTNNTIKHEDLNLIYDEEYKLGIEKKPFWTLKRLYHQDKDYKAIDPLSDLFKRIKNHHGHTPNFLSKGGNTQAENCLYVLYWQMQNPLRGLVGFYEYYGDFYKRYVDSKHFPSDFLGIMELCWDGYEFYANDPGLGEMFKSKVNKLVGHNVSSLLTLNMEFCDPMYVEDKDISKYYTPEIKDYVVNLLSKKYKDLKHKNIELLCTRIRRTAVFYAKSEYTIIDALGLEDL